MIRALRGLRRTQPLATFPPTSWGGNWAQRRWAGSESEKKSRNVLFFGTSAIAVPALRALHAAKSQTFPGTQTPIVGDLQVVCPPGKTAKNKTKYSEVELCARELSIPLHPMEPTVGFRMDGYSMPTGRFDLGVVISFGYFIRPDMIDSFPMGMINAHGSVLPKFRGASPIQHALLHGEQQSGITVTTLHPKVIDEGKVLKRSPVDIPAGATFASLCAMLDPVAARDIVDVVTQWEQVYPAAIDQAELMRREGGPPPAHLRLAPKIKPERGMVRWEDPVMGAREAYRLWQALTGYLPVFGYYRGKRIMLREISGYTFPGSDVVLRGHPTDPQVPAEEAIAGAVAPPPSPAEAAAAAAAAEMSSADPSPAAAAREKGPVQGHPGVVKGTKGAGLAGLATPRPAGSMRFDPVLRSLRVLCADGLELLVRRVQIESKEEVSAEQFGEALRSTRVTPEQAVIKASPPQPRKPAMPTG